MKRLNKIPFFLLLLPLFFSLHGWEQHYGFISFTDVFKPGLIILSVLVSATFIVYLATKNLLQASLIIFFLSLWYLFFGAFYDWAAGVPYLHLLKSYTAILVFLLVVTAGWIFFLARFPHLHKKIAAYLNLLLLIYIAIDVFALLFQPHPAGTHQQKNPVSFDTNKVVQKPDVYLLVFDGYPGAASLQDSFNFSNDSLYSYFFARDFEVLPVFSNYDLTYFSMSALLNMNYVTRDFDPAQITQRDFQRRGVEIKNAALFHVFESMGYEIKNLSIFDIGNKRSISGKNSFLLAHSILITDKMLHNRLKKDAADHLRKLIPFWKNDDFYEHDRDNKLAQQLLLKTIEAPSAKPQFVYTHFMMPHGPYYYDSLGRLHPYEKISHHSMWNNKELFISYLKYVNQKITSLTDSIIAHDADALIMIMGDHGFRNYRKRKNVMAPVFDNLCAVRFPGGSYPFITNRWSMVNLFRYTLNSNFGQSIPYLPDSSVILKY